MIITIAGDAGSGKSSVARLVAGKLGLRHYSVGDFMREIARKRGVTLLEISRLAETDRFIDEELDGMQVSLGKKESGFVLDSRLGWHFIPKSFKVFLKVKAEEGARRIFSDMRKEEMENASLKATIGNIKKRKSSEIQRYRKYYGLNPYDDSHYDLVVDTTRLTAEEAADRVVESIRNK